MSRSRILITRAFHPGPRPKLAVVGFVAVGSVAAAVDLALFAYLVYLPSADSAVQSSFEAKIISVSIAIGLAFVGNNYFSFKGEKRFSVIARFSSFFSVYAAAAVIQTIMLTIWIGLLVEADFWSKVLVNASVILITTVFRFFFALRIFRRRLESPATPGELTF